MRRRIPEHILTVGFVLPGDVLDDQRRVLLKAGRCLTETEVALLHRYVYRGMYAGSGWPDDMPACGSDPETSEAASTTLSVDQLRAGMVLSQAIYDADNVLLLAGGTEITQRFLQLLRRRNIRTVTLGPDEPELTVDDAQLTRADALDEAIDAELKTPIPVQHIKNVERPRLPAGELGRAVRGGLERHAATRDLVVDVCRRVSAGDTASGADLHDAVDDFAKLITNDFDVVPLVVSLQKSKGDYLFDHCVNTALTGMSICAQLGWTRDQMAEAGLGTILQDIGMLRVPDSIRMAPRRLTLEERYQIEGHPYHAVDRLDRVTGMPASATFIAYQSHERGDRSGYPKQRSGMYVHPYAKIVAIADSYAAMTHPRPFRPAMLPYRAAKTILVEGGADKYDRTFVRAFLDAVSLFPIGSCVVLSDGSRGRVIRANSGYHTRPVVEEIETGGRATGRIVDLSREDGIRVVDVFASPAAPSVAAVGGVSQ